MTKRTKTSPTLAEWRERAHRAEEMIRFIIDTNERSPRDPVYEEAVRRIGSHGCGAIMSAARHVWTDLLDGQEGAHSIAPPLPVLRAAIGKKPYR